MNNISDYEAHKRDEEWDKTHESEYAKLPKCPIHHVTLIWGHGYVDLVTKAHMSEVFNPPKCPECLRLEAQS